MKARFFLLFVTIFTVSQFAKAESDKVYSDRRLSEAISPIKYDINSWTKVTSSNTKEIKVLNERIQKLESDVSSLQEKVDSLWKKGATNLETIGRKGDKTDIKANVALWITIPIVMVICGVLGLAFWPRKSKPVPISATRSDQHKCPRCGWEHDPDDTVCRNPNCKVQF